jgi:N-formylglutamate deformylase
MSAPQIIQNAGYVTTIQRKGPLVLGMPHIGTMIPPEVSVTLNDVGRAVPDTDWWLDRLYTDIAERFDATVVMAGVSRFVIDVNRDPSGISLYPGQNTTTLCPLTTFDNMPIYIEGQKPDQAEISRRQQVYFQPFHDAMASALDRVRTLHEYAVLYDCHSIRSECPHLFEGILPTLNLGTNSGASCALPLQQAAETGMASSGFSHVSNGRFKGGFITRHYGQPNHGVHALQMEITQSAYMQEHAPWTFDAMKAGVLQRAVTDIIAGIMAAAAALAHPPSHLPS